jgi:NTP pyrophosphatase (non-canonical NTP hydrolase)
MSAKTSRKAAGRESRPAGREGKPAKPGLVLLATTHRVAPGLLSWRAWDTLRSAGRVLAGSEEHPLLPYVLDAGVAVEVTGPVARELVDASRGERVVWLAAPDGDERLMREIGQIAVEDPVDIEVLHGSYDLPGARLLDLVSVMDTLRRECPWDREQTHESLVRYLLEESYEVAETVEEGDLGALREELGDVLMQVAFHSVVASEREDETAFTIDADQGGRAGGQGRRRGVGAGRGADGPARALAGRPASAQGGTGRGAGRTVPRRGRDRRAAVRARPAGPGRRARPRGGVEGDLQGIPGPCPGLGTGAVEPPERDKSPERSP